MLRLDTKSGGAGFRSAAQTHTFAFLAAAISARRFDITDPPKDNDLSLTGIWYRVLDYISLETFDEHIVDVVSKFVKIKKSSRASGAPSASSGSAKKPAPVLKLQHGFQAQFDQIHKTRILSGCSAVNADLLRELAEPVARNFWTQKTTTAMAFDDDAYRGAAQLHLGIVGFPGLQGGNFHLVQECKACHKPVPLPELKCHALRCLHASKRVHLHNTVSKAGAQFIKHVTGLSVACELRTSAERGNLDLSDEEFDLRPDNSVKTSTGNVHIDYTVRSAKFNQNHTTRSFKEALVKGHEEKERKYAPFMRRRAGHTLLAVVISMFGAFHDSALFDAVERWAPGGQERKHSLAHQLRQFKEKVLAIVTAHAGAAVFRMTRGGRNAIRRPLALRGL